MLSHITELKVTVKKNSAYSYFVRIITSDILPQSIGFSNLNFLCCLRGQVTIIILIWQVMAVNWKCSMKLMHQHSYC